MSSEADALFGTMRSLEESIANVKGMIYGESGVGKTVFGMKLAQAITPSDKRILHLDAVEGWVSLKNHPELLKRVDRMAYQGLAHLDAVVKYANEGVAPMDSIGTIVLDELSTMSKLDLDIVLAGRAKKDRSKDPDVPTQPDFFANTERVRRSTTKLLALPINIIILSHQRDDKEESTGRLTIRPAFMPKVSETLRANLHFVVHMTADEATVKDKAVYRYELQVHPTKKVVAKCRIGNMEPIETPENFMAITSEWMKGAVPDQDETKIPELNDEESITSELDDAIVID